MHRHTAPDTLRLRSAHVVAATGRAGNQPRKADIAARRRESVYDVRGQCRLACGRGHVNRRRLTGNGDRFFESADAELDFYRRLARAAQRHTIPLDRIEAGETERDAV